MNRLVALSLVPTVVAMNLLVAGCGLLDQRVVEVKVPVAVRAVPPPELVQCGAGLPLPTFEACAPSGWSCLRPDQEARLRTLVHGLAACNEGWRTFATKPGTN